MPEISPTTKLYLQAAFSFLQVVNGGLVTVTKNPLVMLLVAAALTAIQVLLQHAGNQAPPSPPKA